MMAQDCISLFLGNDGAGIHVFVASGEPPARIVVMVPGTR